MRLSVLLVATGILPIGLALVACSAEQDKTESKAMTTEDKNKLADSNSPYLLSHADNPVNWYPWGDEALQKAKAEDKPIFLSIGYAACHWCHVMEHESFENEEIARVLNEHFVSIKVDREQRPDLDQIYMSFTQALTGQGGWPMSVFLTPDLKPFFAGTYFPPDDRFGRPGFMKVITEISGAYDEQKEQIVESADSIFDQVSGALNRKMGQEMLRFDMLEKGVKELMSGFDDRFGGFGQAPKFPHAMELSLFLRHYRRTGDLSYLQAAEKALNGMADGGIHDQIGGGFARYSVDERWLVPHFEKMLYDNALLVRTYAEAFQITGKERYREVVRSTLDWVLREMTDSNGGFYSAIDADSEGEEGKFYVWTPDQIREVLGSDADLFMQYYNVTDRGNFEGKNILNRTSTSERVKDEAGIDDFDSFIDNAKQQLLEAREKRVRPLTDDKILTSWNGLMLSAFSRGYQITGDEKYLNAARNNAEFVQDSLFKDGRLTHAYREGSHTDEQFLEDYGYYLIGLVDLYQTDVSGDNARWLQFAGTLADTAVKLFQEDDGTLYLREENQGDLIYRPRHEIDGAVPAPGSMLLNALFKLNRLTGDKRLLEHAEKGLRAVSGLIERSPSGMTSALFALDYYLNDKIEIVIVGDGDVRREMLDRVYKKFLPNAIIAASEDGSEDAPLFEGREVSGSEVKAYICRNSVCKLPVSTVANFEEQLNEL